MAKESTISFPDLLSHVASDLEVGHAEHVRLLCEEYFPEETRLVPNVAPPTAEFLIDVLVSRRLVTETDMSLLVEILVSCQRHQALEDEVLPFAERKAGELKGSVKQEGPGLKRLSHPKFEKLRRYLELTRPSVYYLYDRYRRRYLQDDTMLDALCYVLGDTFRRYLVISKTFFHGARNGDCALVERYHELLANVNAKEHDGNTALHMAAAKGHVDVAAKLLSLLADVDITNDFGDTPLHHTGTKGHPEVAKILIEYDAYVNIRNEDDDTPLHCAARTGHASVVAVLCENRALRNPVNKNGDYPLHLATEWDQFFALRELLRHGADANTTNKDQDTALHLAACLGHVAHVERLLCYRANIQAKNKFGKIPIELARNMKASEPENTAHSETIFLLEKAEEDIEQFTPEVESTLHFAAFYGLETLVRNLVLKDRANVNAQGAQKSGDSALHAASLGGHTPCAKILVENDADVNIRNKIGDSPLHHAAARGRTDTAFYLIRNGADLDALNEAGETPLHHAGLYGHSHTAALLVQQGADILIQSKTGTTALHHAAGAGYAPAVDALIDLRVDMDAVDQDGNSALHWAVSSGHQEAMESLVEGGIDVNIQNKFQETALHMASRMNRLAMVQVLLAYGSNVHRRNTEYAIAMQYAAHSINPRIARSLATFGSDVNIACFTKKGKIKKGVLKEKKEPPLGKVSPISSPRLPSWRREEIQALENLPQLDSYYPDDAARRESTGFRH
ncbi:uncharacterized protein LOC144917494 [Branchiostoma floridae x Branchiostoma belcheri]